MPSKIAVHLLPASRLRLRVLSLKLTLIMYIRKPQDNMYTPMSVTQETTDGVP